MTPLKLTVIGCGYLGAVHAAAMAHLGHHVLGIDTRTEQVEALSQGRAPFYEPGLPELLITGAQQGDLSLHLGADDGGAGRGRYPLHRRGHPAVSHRR